MKFSVLISIYFKESPEFFRLALESINEQTLQADEVVIVKDGPLTEELDKVIEDFSFEMPLKLVPLDKNVGLGKALQIGVKHCSYEYIARMDSDDICRSDRFEKQINFLKANPDIDVVGSWISEFESKPENIYAIRELPAKHEDIVRFAKRRNPLNHMTVFFKKDTVLRVGNYSDYGFAQDYHLWVRMIIAGGRFANISETLVNVRAGESMVIRRSGKKYALNEHRLQKEFYELGFTNYYEFVSNVMIRVMVRFLPLALLRQLYKQLRNNK